jgi:hypothetical protein
LQKKPQRFHFTLYYFVNNSKSMATVQQRRAHYQHQPNATRINIEIAGGNNSMDGDADGTLHTRIERLECAMQALIQATQAKVSFEPLATAADDKKKTTATKRKSSSSRSSSTTIRRKKPASVIADKPSEEVAAVVAMATKSIAHKDDDDDTLDTVTTTLPHPSINKADEPLEMATITTTTTPMAPTTPLIDVE